MSRGFRWLANAYRHQVPLRLLFESKLQVAAARAMSLPKVGRATHGIRAKFASIQ